MIKYILCYFFLLGFQQSLAQPNLDALRKAYPLASTDKEVCKKQLATLQTIENLTNIELAYSGAYHAVWAKHAESPLARLNSFKKGKDELERAIAKDNANIEIRFLRLTIQYHAPKIVRYKINIDDDLQVVLAQYDQISSKIIKDNIKDFLSQTNLLSSEQRQKFK